MRFKTGTRIEVAAPDALFASLMTHLKEHGTSCAPLPDSDRIEFGDSHAFLHKRSGGIDIEAEAASESGLYYLRMMLAEHVLELSEDRPRMIWTGHGADRTEPPNFRVMTVVAVTDITPHMRRLTLKGDDLAWFASDDLHVRLCIPPHGVEPVWPRLSESGVIVWPADEAKLHVRKYTIRRIDVAAGTLDIDFVLHADAGPGSAFAAAARAGDVVGMAGPGGGGYGLSDWNLFAGDETALPAIARILEAMPRDSRGEVFIEVAGSAEEQAIDAPAGMAIRWLHRNGAEAGTTDLLIDALRSADWPEGDTYVWAACEFEAFRKIRSYLRKERQLPRDRHLVIAYWRRGQSEDTFAATKRHEH